MKKTARAIKRQARAARAAKRVVHINIVSLIDIFAILVFYLLVNALVVEVLPSFKSIKLPESSIQDDPQDTIVVLVTPDEILVKQGGKTVKAMDVSEAHSAEGRILAGLKAELYRQPVGQIKGGSATDTSRGEVNIMADRSIPYSVLKKVMATCTEMRFAKISLAVLQKKGAGE